MSVRSISLQQFILLVVGLVTAFVLAAFLVGRADATLRTSTVFSSTGEGVDVIPYLRVDKNALFVDFEHKDFNNIEYVYFNLNYDTDEPETKRGVEGSFVPSQVNFDGSFGGKSYVRRELQFGTCSKNVCTYNKGVRDIKLTVNTKFLSGSVDQYTKVLTFPNDQL